MMQFAHILLVLLCAMSVTRSQANGDHCHVYVIDVTTARKALENFKPTGNQEADAKALSVGVTQFPQFVTDVGEEKLTTKNYGFPGSPRLITASVYYTDESMASHAPKGAVLNDSISLGITVADKAVPDATQAVGAAVTEVTYDQHTNTVRSKQYIRVDGRDYLVGIQCDCTRDTSGTPK
jgi:hypothetical protein